MVPSMTSWDSEQYLRFAEERTRPCRDLSARVILGGARSIVDLGCGPGNSASVLRERWPRAELTGVDSAPDMLARARRDLPDLRWEEGDIGSWQPGRTYDLVFSNAALHWVPDHAALLPRLLTSVAEGGALAFQMPANLDAPAHRLMRELAATPRFRGAFTAPVREWHTEEIADYYDILSPHVSRLDLWVTEYQHVLAGPAAITEWYKGTGLRPFLDALPGEAEQGAFLSEYTALVAAAFPAQRDGRVIFPFRRIFAVAYR
jgi:trans-aconitate 2-methyltransferase